MNKKIKHIMKQIEIKEEFKKLIPPLTTEEYKQLEDNCLEEGVREKIILWNNYIIDGHNRYNIAKQWNLEFETKSKNFSSEEAVKEWMILNQFGRRNLSNYQRSVLGLQLEEVFKAQAKERMLSGNPVLISEQGRTIEKIGKVASVGKDTIAKVKKIQEKAPEEIKAKLATGEVSINAAYKEIKKEEKKENFKTKKLEFEKPIININTNQKIILGDSRVVLKDLKEKSFDLLLSDPPYGMDFKSGWNNKNKIKNDKIEDTVKLFDDVLKLSVPLLKDDAHFYLFGNINYINEIKPIIEKYLNIKNVLIWDRQIIGMGDLKTYGNSYDIIYFGYNKKWKDLNGTRDRDVLNYKRIEPSKNIHPTEKPQDILQYLIKKSSKENDNILEPFAGGGSTLLACKQTNRFATGIEIEKNYYELIKKRI
jgi:DNA modification methylase